jgi:hypothetical protein
VPGRPEDDPLFRYLDGEMRDRLARAINDLPERERLVLTLYYYEEVSMKEIGLYSRYRGTSGLPNSRFRRVAPSSPARQPRADRRTPTTTTGHKAPPQSSKAKNQEYNSRSHRLPTRTI